MNCRYLTESYGTSAGMIEQRIVEGIWCMCLCVCVCVYVCVCVCVCMCLRVFLLRRVVGNVSIAL